MATTRKPKKTRVTIDLSDRDYKKAQQLRERFGNQTTALRKGLRLIHYLCELQDQGVRDIKLTPDGKDPISIPLSVVLG